MIHYEDQCVGCAMGCIDCGRKRTKVYSCDECGDETQELWYGDDNGMYCKHCITNHMEKVEVD